MPPKRATRNVSLVVLGDPAPLLFCQLPTLRNVVACFYIYGLNHNVPFSEKREFAKVVPNDIKEI